MTAAPSAPPAPRPPSRGASRPEAARAQREQRQRQLLDAARSVFAEKGYHGATVGDVIERADVARGTFYLYFTSKRTLFDALLDQILAEVEGRVRRVDVSPAAPPPLEQLHANLIRLLQLFQANPDYLRIFLWEAVGVDHESEEKLALFHQRMFALTRRSLETGVSLGLLRPCHTELLARCLVGAFKEMAVSLLVRKDVGAGDLDSIARELLRFALSGLAFQG